MFEPVLCVTKNDFESLFQSLHAPVPGNTTVYVHGVTPQQWRDLSVPYAFVGRDACETDDDLKQMIPYVIVRHGGKYLAYSRTSQSGEKRLVGKRSVGIGGHINPTDVPDGDPPLNAILRRCAARGTRILKTAPPFPTFAVQRLKPLKIGDFQLFQPQELQLQQRRYAPNLLVLTAVYFSMLLSVFVSYMQIDKAPRARLPEG